MKNSKAHFTDLDSERSFIGGIMAEQTIPESLQRKITAEAFSEQNRLTVRAILSAFKKSGRCDILTVSQELVHLGGGLNSNDMLIGLAQSAPVGANLDHLYGLILERNGHAENLALKDRMTPLPDFLRKKRDAPPQTVKDFGWGPGGALLAAAMGGLGKTLLLQSLAVDLGTGSLLLGRFHAEHDQRVAIFLMEDPLHETQDRFAKIIDGRDVERANVWIFDNEKESLILGDKWGDPNEKGFSFLDQVLGDLGITVLLLDPLVYLHHTNENDNSMMLRWLIPLRNLCRKHRTALGISHHTTWGGQDQQHERGASAIRNWADTVLHLRSVQGKPGDIERRRLSVAKMNFGKPFDPLIASINPVTLRVTLDSEGATLCTPEDLLAFIQDDLGGGYEGKLTDFYQQASTHFGASNKTVRNAWAKLQEKVTVHEQGKGKGFKLT